ncbi:MAG: dual specificity protein phosphatase family protein, partial [Candidatus Roizmanbacteria bacterium]
MSLILDNSQGRDGELWISNITDLILPPLGQDFVIVHQIEAVVSTLIFKEGEQCALMAVLNKDPSHRISHLHIPVTDRDEDKDNISDYFEVVAHFIQEHRMRGKNVLVHCHAGKSRSVTFVTYYLLRLGIGMTVKEIIKMIKTKREVARPRKSFVKTLQKIEQQHFNS